MENDPCTVDLPLKIVVFHSYVNVYQGVTPTFNVEIRMKSSQMFRGEMAISGT